MLLVILITITITITITAHTEPICRAERLLKVKENLELNTNFLDIHSDTN